MLGLALLPRRLCVLAPFLQFGLLGLKGRIPCLGGEEAAGIPGPALARALVTQADKGDGVGTGRVLQAQTMLLRI